MKHSLLRGDGRYMAFNMSSAIGAHPPPPPPLPSVSRPSAALSSTTLLSASLLSAAMSSASLQTVAANWCSNGIRSNDGSACCAASCGRCSDASGCSLLPGGRPKCCLPFIRHKAKTCMTSFSTGCIALGRALPPRADLGQAAPLPRASLSQAAPPPPAENASSPVHYNELADAILGVGVRPFENASSWLAAGPDHWYKKSAFSVQHEDLATHLMRVGGHGCWVLEVGSFIGNSAATWARASRVAGLSFATVVAMDSWLGDVGMWQWKGKWLGPRSIDGSPRLYEQFMANIKDKNVADRVLPLRVPSSVGLRYLVTLVRSKRIPPPHLVYLDAAHEYPETLQELQWAWRLLPPGGFLVGDDFDRFWPSVQQSVVEFSQSLAAGEVDLPARYALGWRNLLPLKRMRVAVLNGEPASQARILLKNSQWLLRKAPASDLTSTPRNLSKEVVKPASQEWPFLRATTRCCLNGWTGHDFLTCRPATTFMMQRTCNVHGVHEAGGESRGVGRCHLYRCMGCSPRDEPGCSD